MIKVAGFQKILESQIEKYHITLSNGLKFWSPYIKNSNYTQDKSAPRGVGKSSPQEIQVSAEYILDLFPNIDTKTLRKKLIDGSLPDKSMNYKGVDCSGFIYLIFEQIYLLQGKKFSDVLSVPKANVLNGANNYEEWKAVYILSKEEAAKLPEDVPMTWVVDTFHRKPVNLCQAAGLVSDFSSTLVTISDAQIGDIVHMNNSNDDVPHVAIITEVFTDRVLVVHSGRKSPKDTGGVLTEYLPLTDGLLYCGAMQSPRNFVAIRRLKGLA